ncbi:hypothetical protein, partial [Streptomyces smaragdinus]|uniref:hypothetical protein n=1 Tax=Streptomyces smaragdinus TaxID=2585196 RepID=UPI0012957587
MGRPRAGATVTAGVLLLLFGLTVVSWMIYDFEFAEVGPGKFLQGLFDPRVYAGPELFGPQIWAMTVVLLTVGILAAAQRPGARGGALVAAWVMLAVSARELTGLAKSDGFRAMYMRGSDLEVVVVTTWVAAVLISVTVLIMLMLPDPDAPAPVPGGPQAVGGALLLFLGAVAVAWIVRLLASDTYSLSTEDYFHHLADASFQNSVVIGGTPMVYDAVFALALLVLGALALTGRAAARGGAVTLAAVLLYLAVREMIGLSLGGGASLDDAAMAGRYPGWSDVGQTTEGKLSLATTVGQAVLCVVVIIVMTAAGRRGATSPPTGIRRTPTWAGSVDRRDTGKPVGHGRPPTGQARVGGGH